MNTCFGALERNLHSSLQCSTNQRFASTSAQSEEQGEVSSASNNASGSGDLEGGNTKPYDVLFKEAVGLNERSGGFGDGGEVVDDGNSELSRRLREVELELKELREKCGGIEPKSKGKSGRRRRRKVLGKVVENDASLSKPNSASSLYALFDNNLKKETEKGESLVARKMCTDETGRKSGGNRKRVVDNERGKSKEGDSSIALFDKKTDVEKYSDELNESEDLIVKELSPEMEVFVRFLYDEGYFQEANFLPGGRFDIKSFESAYVQDFLKFAAEKFGRDKQEIAKWLSGSDLKTIATFGCPSNDKRIVFAAKSLRTFFQIPENTVCCKCTLRESCKFENQNVWKSGSTNLNLPSLMRLLTVYALEAIPPQLMLPEDIKACVNRLMKDVINLSKTVQEAA